MNQKVLQIIPLNQIVWVKYKVNGIVLRTQVIAMGLTSNGRAIPLIADGREFKPLHNILELEPEPELQPFDWPQSL